MVTQGAKSRKEHSILEMKVEIIALQVLEYAFLELLVAKKGIEVLTPVKLVSDIVCNLRLRKKKVANFEVDKKIQAAQ